MNTQNAGEKSRNSIPNVLACAEKNDFQKRPKMTTFYQRNISFQNMPHQNEPFQFVPTKLYNIPKYALLK